MPAKKNSDIEDTIVTLHELTDDEKIKLQCEAREHYERDMASAIDKGYTLTGFSALFNILRKMD